MTAGGAVTAAIVSVLVVVPTFPACGKKSTPSGPTAVVVPPSAPVTTPPAPLPVNRPPTATIVDVQPPGTALAGGTRVSFGGKGQDPDGDPLVLTWDFGDGQTGAGEGVAHTYYRDGTFEVTLTVTDGRGGSAMAQVTVIARRLTGRWRLHNPREVLDVTIAQDPGRSATFEGWVSDGSRFTGRTSELREVSVTYEPSADSCVPAETLVGEANEGVDRISFDGAGCRRMTLVRR
jgi:hypothetical protein